MSRVRVLISALIAVIGLLTPAFAAAQTTPQPQNPVTAAEIAGLESSAADIARQADALKTTDPTLSLEVSRTLADLNEDITYLKVKLRREGSVPRADYSSVRDRLDTLRARANRSKVNAQPTFGDGETTIITVPVATQFDVRLQTHLNSETARVEQRFEATTLLDFTSSGRVVIPAGTLVRGFVSSVRPAGRVDRRGSMTLSFDEMRIGEQTLRLRASVVQALDGKVSEDAARIGVGAIAGAIIGGVLGGGKGALIGVMVGGGGTIAATEGTDVDIPLGTILRIRLDQPVDVPVR
jgi:hypothetical protein